MLQSQQLNNGSSTTLASSVSVIIPALNEEKFIERCLSCLEQQRFPAEQLEVILVDNGSTDRTIEIARSFSGSLNLKILRKSGCYISAIRNLGALSAKGRFLAFLDADCFPPSDWLARAIHLFQSGENGIVGSFYTVPEGSSWVAKAWYEDMPRLRQGSVSYVPSGNLFIRRATFLELGGFDPTLQTCEDFEFCQRATTAGYRVSAFRELSPVHAGTPQTLGGFYRKQRWHGNGVRTMFIRDMLHPGLAKTILQTAFTVFCMLIAVFAVPIAMATGRWAWLAVGPVLLIVSSFILAARAAFQGRSWSSVGALTVIYLVYGVARALSLIGLNGKRKAPSLPPAMPEPAAATVGSDTTHR
jgi:glycosyltransferase involved in cell wall biosynthesis